jgi:hypothetical protein
MMGELKNYPSWYESRLRTFTAESPSKGKVLGLDSDTYAKQRVSDGQNEVEQDARLAWIAAKLVSSNRDTR